MYDTNCCTYSSPHVARHCRHQDFLFKARAAILGLIQHRVSGQPIPDALSGLGPAAFYLLQSRPHCPAMDDSTETVTWDHLARGSSDLGRGVPRAAQEGR